MTKEKIIKEILHSTFFDGKDYDEAYRCCDKCVTVVIDKACDWLKKVNDKRFNGFDIVYTQFFIKEFRKAMEE